MVTYVYIYSTQRLKQEHCCYNITFTYICCGKFFKKSRLLKIEPHKSAKEEESEEL